MTEDEIEWWKAKVEVIRLKEGRTLTTAIIHVTSDEEPALEVLLRAARGWTGLPLGQAVRRPDEEGKQVYWVNIVN